MHYTLTLPSKADTDAFIESLSIYGAEFLSATEELSGETSVIFAFPDEQDLPQVLVRAEPLCFHQDVDWEAQWREHCPCYVDGHFALKIGECTLRLKAGPGFGDLSHPTTRLALDLLMKTPDLHNVLDVGCGSGILALAAAHLGAHHVIGVDIDPKAVAHARCNAELGIFSGKLGFFHVDECSLASFSDPLLLLNMTFAEQKNALRSLRTQKVNPEAVITSGILVEQAKSYLDFIRSEMRWQLVDQRDSNGWMAFRFNG